MATPIDTTSVSVVLVPAGSEVADINQQTREKYVKGWSPPIAAGASPLTSYI